MHCFGKRAARKKKKTQVARVCNMWLPSGMMWCGPLGFEKARSDINVSHIVQQVPMANLDCLLRGMNPAGILQWNFNDTILGDTNF